jgi:hypothetical protein
MSGREVIKILIWIEFETNLGLFLPSFDSELETVISRLTYSGIILHLLT